MIPSNYVKGYFLFSINFNGIENTFYTYTHFQIGH